MCPIYHPSRHLALCAPYTILHVIYLYIMNPTTSGIQYNWLTAPLNQILADLFINKKPQYITVYFTHSEAVKHTSLIWSKCFILCHTPLTPLSIDWSLFHSVAFIQTTTDRVLQEVIQSDSCKTRARWTAIDGLFHALFVFISFRWYKKK
jgi:hypothetical protein